MESGIQRGSEAVRSPSDDGAGVAAGSPGVVMVKGRESESHCREGEGSVQAAQAPCSFQCDLGSLLQS